MKNQKKIKLKKNKKIKKISHYLWTVPKSTRTIVKRGNINTPNTQIHDRSLYVGSISIPLTHKYMTDHFM